MWQRIIAASLGAIISGCAHAAEPDTVRFAYPPFLSQVPGLDFLGALGARLGGVGRVDGVQTPNALAALRAGTADVGLVSVGQMAELKSSGLSLFGLPFLFDDLNHVARFQQGAIGEAALASVDAEGLVGLGYWNFGTQRVLARKPVTSVDAFKGLKISTTGSTQLRFSLQALGASPVPAQGSEILEALTKGVTDAVSASPTSINANRLYESGRALTTQPLVPLTYLVVANQSSWNAFPYRIQAAIAGEVAAAAARLNNTVPELEGKALGELRERGVQFVSLSSGDVQDIRTAETKGPGAQKIEADRLATLGLQVIDQDRRQPIPPDKNLDLIPQAEGQTKLFFITDRRSEAAADPNVRFGSQRQDGPPTYGTMTVDLGNRPAAGPPTRTVIKALTTFSNAQDFTTALTESIKASGKNEVLIYVHGYNNSFVDAAESAASIIADLQFRGVGVVFSWPSDGAALQYPHDEAEEGASEQNFVEVLQSIRGIQGDQLVDVVAHSMGNRVVTGAVRLIAANPNVQKPILHQLILAAPDVYTVTFNQVIGDMIRLSDRVTLYASAADQALRCSELLHQGPRAGLAGPDLVVTKGLDTIDVSKAEQQSFLDKVAANIPGVGMINWLLNKACREGHSYVTREFSVVNDLHSLVILNAPPENRILLEKRPATNNTWYWEMRPVAH
jgi:TRAP-type C4-dicarboxylate transport system substrate-binding protein/esterase/lipase superfamily enzyme